MNAEELRDQVRGELELMSRTVSEIERALEAIGDNTPTVFQRAGFGALLMNLYKGIENTLMRIARFEGMALPTGDRWHVEFFRRFTEAFPTNKPALFDAMDQQTFRPYRDFRHVMVHGYGVVLKWELMRDLVVGAPAAFDRFRRRIDEYLAAL
ncbi:MAG: hypothetical protein FJ272_20055 [Planctomycetes bacterium]|nr:hypothetical protein [Planctomycetota bacterium]